MRALEPARPAEVEPRPVETMAAARPQSLGMHAAGAGGTPVGEVARAALFGTIDRAVRAAVGDALAPAGLSAEDCPYVARYLEAMRHEPIERLARRVRLYARPATDTLEGWTAAIARRAHRSALEWRADGRDPLVEHLSPTAQQSLTRHKTELDRLRGIEAQLGRGRPLETNTRLRIEASFRADLSDVRVHTDEAAQRLAADEGAASFAVGSHIAFAGGEYRPGTAFGEVLIAHEAAHVVQQRRSGAAAPSGLEREADSAAAAVALGRPASALSGGGLRLQRCMLPSSAPRDERTIDEVRRDFEESGELGPRTDVRPVPADYAAPETSSPPLSAADRAALSATPRTLTVAEMLLDLGQIRVQLDAMQPLMTGRPTGDSALLLARAQVEAARTTVATADAAQMSRRILRTRVVLQQTERALSQLQLARPSLTASELMHHTGYTREFDRVTALFDTAVGRAVQGDVLERFQEADRAAADLPMALMRADLSAFGSLSAGAALLQPSIRDIHAWAARLTARLEELQVHAREVAAARARGAADLADREARFRDESDSISLSIEALSYWEQLARGYAYLAGHPPYDMRAIDGIGRLMTRVRHMRDADERGDVALLELLVRRYREDEHVHRFLDNLGVFVAFSRFAVSMGIVLVAAMASAGIGAGATAMIGTTTTTAGTVTAFVGVTALEALTFTAISRGLQSVLPGQQTQGTFLGDLAWNFGLFFVLKVANLGVAAATRSVALPQFTRLVSHTVSYPLLLGYGAIHQRVATGEWPTAEQFDRMAAETLFLMAGFSIVSRRGATSSMPRELQVFRSRYGLQFEALDAGRVELANRIIEASRSGPVPDPVNADLARRARIMEDNLRALVDQIRADPQIRLPELRNALRGLAVNTEAFALQVRLMEAGLTAAELTTVDARLAAVPEPVRESTAAQLRTGVEYATRTVPDAAARRGAIEVMTRVGTNQRIGGFGGWVRFSTAQRPGVAPAEQTRNFLDDVGELQVAESMSATAGPRARVEVGGDARADLRPGTVDQLLPSFDIRVVGERTGRNVEVYSPTGARPVVGDLGAAINHAADKVISDPALPAHLRTTGRVEAAVRIPWPPPDNVVGAGTLRTAPNGDVTLIGGDGVHRPRGNFFGDYLPILNGERGAAPAGAARVDVLSVYDRAGNLIYRYTRSAGRWTGTLL
ncbi:DUF4157 domain-containing protein [Myxococcota bacterium]|nr:DUF4157 domain-containing protein [Myxococcota bacterium]